MAMLLKFPTGLNLARLTGHSRHQEKDFSPNINRQKVRMPGIACNDASTHGKFIVKASDE